MYENNDSAAPVLIGNQLFAADGKANYTPARAGTKINEVVRVLQPAELGALMQTATLK